MTNSSDALIVEIERRRKKQKRLRLLLLLIPVVLIISYFDWQRNKDDIRHGLTLSERRALVSEYFSLEKATHDSAKFMFPLYESDSTQLASYFEFVENKGNEHDTCLFLKFGVNDSIFTLINEEGFNAAWYDKNGKKRDFYDKEVLDYWRYWEFKKPACPF